MRATVMHGAGDVRIETVSDARLIEPTDALVRVTRAAICGSDLWPYKTMEHSDTGRRMGHEFIGDEFLSSDFTMYYSDPEARHGRDEHKEFLLGHTRAFPGERWTVQRIVPVWPAC